MRLKSRLLNAVAGVACAALLASSLSGCANMREPRSWGTCAILGGLLGAGVGAASGIVIADNTAGRHHSDNDTRVYAGVGGAVIGAGLGALAGHYICDPLIPPPPPPPPPPQYAWQPPAWQGQPWQPPAPASAEQPAGGYRATSYAQPPAGAEPAASSAPRNPDATPENSTPGGAV